MEMLSLAIPPIEKTNMLYIITRVDVNNMLFLSNWGLPNEINTVFTANATIIRREIMPCQESAPKNIIVAVRMTTEG